MVKPNWHSFLLNIMIAFLFLGGPVESPAAVPKKQWAVPPQQITLTIPVQASSDDAAQAQPGDTVGLGQNFLPMGDIGGISTYVGLRFANLNVPQGATITSATLTFTASGPQNPGVTSLAIAGHDVGDSPTFSSIDGPADRTANLTNAQVSWNPAAWSSGGTYQSADIAAVIQEIVNRSDWSAGQALSLIVSDADGVNGVSRRAMAFDGDPALAPQLSITFDVAGLLVVNATDDLDDGACTAGHCSLREAVNAANAAAGPNVIAFDLSGSPPYVIGTASLPALTDPATVIDGSTQSGFAGSPVIEITDPSGIGPAPAIRILGTDAMVRGLSLVGNSGPGIVIEGPGANGVTIEDNYIGVHADGVSPNGNGFVAGLVIANGAGSTQVFDNVLSGNPIDGLRIGPCAPPLCSSASSGVTSVLIQGNRIGTDAGGVSNLGNGSTGVNIQDSNNITISDNLVSGNSAGITIQDSSSVSVQSNKIGTDLTGNSAIGNGDGIAAFGVGSGVTIGGSNLMDGNLISGNSGNGVFAGVPGMLVQNNWIGVDVNGTLALPNIGFGVSVSADDVQILENVISGNQSHGVTAQSGLMVSNVILAGNHIGTSPAGDAALGNTGDGISTTSISNWQILDNVISGNGANGVSFITAAAGNLLQGNLIGLNTAGDSPLPNSMAGLSVGSGSTGNQIGSAAASNTISGNGHDGILIVGDGNTVAGNRIGTSTDGMAAIANSNSGISVLGDSNVIGGSAGDGNLISGNGDSGVRIQAADGTIVQLNQIGSDALGSGDLPNGDHGIQITGATNTSLLDNSIIANASDGILLTNASLSQIVGNTIDHNSANGILLTNNTDSNTLSDNQILNNGFNGISIQQSTDVTLQSNVIESNGEAGVVLNGATGTTVIANTIHNNTEAGIFMTDSLPNNQQNTVSQNSTYNNGGLGIDLAPTGVNINDAGDGDSGPNTQLNFPENLSVNGDDVSGTACSGCTVEVFIVQLDISGHGEGRTFIGSGVASGGSFTITTSGMPLYGRITTTATDASGNSSEFSPNLEVGSNPFQPGIFIVGIFLAGVGIIIVWIAIKNRKGLLPWQKGALLFFGFLLGGAVGVGTARGVESLQPVRGAPSIPTNTPTTALGPAPALPTGIPSGVEQPPTATASASPSPTATPTLTPSATPSPTHTALPSNTPTSTSKPPTKEPTKPPKPPKSTPTSTPKPKKVTPTKPSG